MYIFGAEEIMQLELNRQHEQLQEIQECNSPEAFRKMKQEISDLKFRLHCAERERDLYRAGCFRLRELLQEKENSYEGKRG